MYSSREHNKDRMLTDGTAEGRRDEGTRRRRVSSATKKPLANLNLRKAAIVRLQRRRIHGGRPLKSVYFATEDDEDALFVLHKKLAMSSTLSAFVHLSIPFCPRDARSADTVIVVVPAPH